MTLLALNEPTIGQAEQARVLATLEDGFVSTAGPVVAEFETAFATYLGVKHAVAVSSGTAALHLSFMALGVAAGDLVATSDLTFIASANAVTYTGADLLFVGPDHSTWNLDTEQLYLEIKRRAASGQQVPAAVEPVHILGSPAFWEPLDAITAEFGIPMVEDATESLGAFHRIDSTWQPCGRLGRVGCFSFNGNKMITTGGGGMVVTDDSDLADRIRHLSTQAKLPGVGYQHDEVGFNYRMPALSAALGLAQLERLDDFVAQKLRIRRRYEELLADLPLELVPVPEWSQPAHWLISARLSGEARRCGRTALDHVVAELNDRGIGARPIWVPMHRQLPYAGCDVIASGASAALADTALSLPSSPTLVDEDIERVADALAAALGSLP